MLISQRLVKSLGAGTLGCLLLLVGTASTPADQHFHGSIWSADFERLVVRARPVEPLAFAVRYDAIITLNGARVRLEQLRRWDSVRVTAHMRGDEFVATRIDAWTPP